MRKVILTAVLLASAAGAGRAESPDKPLLLRKPTLSKT